MATNKNQGTGDQAATRSGAETSKQTVQKDTYTVKDGDSLESVAREVGMEPVELVQLNPEITETGSNNTLYTGQEIRLK